MLTNLSHDEKKRLAALKLLTADEHDRDEILAEMTQLTARTLGLATCFILIYDGEKQYIKAAHSLPACVREAHKNQDFTLPNVEAGDVLVCRDMRSDPRFSANALANGPAGIRFYAGAPLHSRDGVHIGTLCLIDAASKTLSDEQMATLRTMSGLISAFLEAWHNIGFIDAVTLLPNRQRLLNDLRLMQSSGKINRYRLMIVDCIDMPFAYEIARSMGIGVVEDMLRGVATLLRSKLEWHDTIYNVATGRYALIMDDAKLIHSATLKERLAGLSTHISTQINVNLHITAGFVTFTPGEFEPAEILRRSVSALHDAISRKKRIMAYESESDDNSKRDFQLLNDFYPHLQGKPGLYLVYQPKITLQTGQVAGLEALIRWQHPELGDVTPDRFIPLLQKTSLMAALTDWVIDTTLNQIQLWGQKNIQLPVSVNVGVSDLSRPQFANALAEKLQRRGLSPALLGIECLETERVLESAAALEGLKMLKSYGFVISLDDFGTGYSNLSYLRKMPIDVIKLDRSIIQPLTTDKASLIIVSHIIRMLKDLDYTVLAEGVEDGDTYDSLRGLGCDEVQGFYYSKPLTAESLETWLENYRAPS